MNKPRTIHYAGQTIKVSPEEHKPAPKAARGWFSRILTALFGCSWVVVLALNAGAATPVLSGTPGVPVVTVFVSSHANTAATGTVTLSSRTTTTNKTFYLQHVDITAFLVAPSSETTAVLGVASLQSPSGTVIATMTFTNSTGAPMPRYVLDLAEPLPFGSQVTISVVGDAKTASGLTWISNLIGFEK